MRKSVIVPVIILFFTSSGFSNAINADEQEKVVAMNPMQVDANVYLKNIKLPDGFTISMYAENVTSARSMTLSPGGTLYVGTFGEWGKGPHGKVYALKDTDGDNRADKIFTVAENLNYPNGVAFRDGNLYVAEISRVLRYDNVEANLGKKIEAKIINDKYPDDFHHGWKFIRFGPDGKLYVPVGAPCNICEVDDPYSTITRINADGSNMEVFARGIRNSVGFDWHPETKELWFTDNGRDLWGNDRPPEELNHAPSAGLHFGYPYRYGKNIVDSTFKTSMSDDDFQAAALAMPAHTAALGIRFYTGKSFPQEYKNRIFIAHHGSWNRNPPNGYRVAMATVKQNKVVDYQVFASGWLMGEKYWGRPVDVEIMHDGSLLVSDDFNGCIYRISYDNN